MAINLSKGQKISLKKDSKKAGLGEILVNLNWSSTGDDIDLDLGCLYELKNGRKSAIQAVGNSFGALDKEPYIALDGDDRFGGIGENLRINGNHISEIKRVLIYTYIYEGIANWKEADAIITIKYPEAEDVIIKMDEFNTSNRLCALALFQNQEDKTFTVEKVLSFYKAQHMMDEGFNWGIKWKPGKK